MTTRCFITADMKLTIICLLTRVVPAIQFYNYTHPIWYDCTANDAKWQR